MEGRTSNLKLGREGLTKWHTGEMGCFVMCIRRSGRGMGRERWSDRQEMQAFEMHLNAACRRIDLMSTLKFNGCKEQNACMMQRVSGVRKC